MEKIFCLALAMLLMAPVQASPIGKIKAVCADAKQAVIHPIKSAKACAKGTYNGMCKIGEWNDRSRMGSFLGLVANLGMVCAGVNSWRANH